MNDHAERLAEVTQFLENMQVRQSRIRYGDVNWYTETANGYVANGPFKTREQAQDYISMRLLDPLCEEEL